MRKFIGLIVSLFVVVPAVIAAPLSHFLKEGVQYDTAIPQPDIFLGHEIGSQPIRHDRMVAYIEALVAASPRLSLETIGHSHEGRPILFVVATSPKNHSQLEALKTAHINNTGADEGKPVVTWLNYGVHGAEASGMDAAVPVLYHLAAATDVETVSALENSIILITAVFNPDGHSRRIAQQLQYGSSVLATDPEHAIHNSAWPGGRTNHYGFDLNRQWLLQTQPESIAWLQKWHEWKPHVSADFHEMGAEASYYFHPGVPSRKHPLVPMAGRDLLVELGGYHARSLDKAGKLYYSEESFDNFYVGKGSTYPQLNGSIGILFEAGGQMGIAQETRQGLKTLADNIQSHVMTSFSTIAGTVKLRSKLQRYQQGFYEASLAEAKKDTVTAYVFRAPEDPVRTDMFITLLRRHQVDVYRLKEAVSGYDTDSYIVPTAQKQYRMVKAIFGRDTEFADKVFYDVSGWTLSLAYGLDVEVINSRAQGYLGASVTGADLPAVAFVPSAYGYLFRWSDYYAPKVLNALLQKGVHARLLKEPFVAKTAAGDVQFGHGAIFIPRHLQTVAGVNIDMQLEVLARENHLQVHSVLSGQTPTVGADLGGRSSATDLTAPKPLLVIGEDVSVYDAGEVWHLLDKRMNMPLTLVHNTRLKDVKLSAYSHLILVDGRGARLSDEVQEKVEGWVKAGGTLVATRRTAKWVSKELLKRKADNGLDNEKSEARGVYATKAQRDARHVIGGAVFESTLDLTHPMAFGLVRQEIATNRNTRVILPDPKDIYARIAVYSDKPLLSGYASSMLQKAIKGTPMMTAERYGSGTIVLFADNPLFRATYPAAEKLFMNTLFFSKAFDKARTEGMEEVAAHTQE